LHSFCSPFELKGGIQLKDRVFPGPMEGILESVFCKTLTTKGLVHSWITPFFRVTTGVPNYATINKFLDIFECDSMPVIVQLMGSNTKLLAKTAQFINNNFPIAGINFNFACPSKTVCSKNSGGALLKDPVKIREIILETKELCPNLSVSIKMRIGYENPEELIRIAPELKKCGLDFIFLHFRTIIEGYRKVSMRKERFQFAKKHFKEIPLFLSGDIMNIEDIIECANSNTGDGIVIARGLIKTPWLIEDARIYLKTGLMPTQQNFKNIHFYCDMLKLACSDSKYWNKNYFAEMGRYLFGVKSEYFKIYKEVCNQNPEDILKKFESL
jgi:tRNA-dihydrouridine synthase